MLFPIVNPYPYCALIPAQYALVSVMMCVARDIEVLQVSLLRGYMVSDGYTL